MGVRFRVGVFGLNLRLASLILAIINILWFWSSRALTDFMHASSGYIENRIVLGVMSRQKYHSRHSGDDGHVGYGTGSLKCCSYRDIMNRSCISDIETSYQTSDMCFVRGKHSSSHRPST